MNEKQLLINRKFDIDGHWYEPLNHIKSFKSVIKANLWDTSSSAGDWSGYFIQKIGETRYLILFFQENDWPSAGFTLTTGEVLASWQGDMETEELESLLESIYVQ